VAGDAFVEAVFAENAEGGGEAALEVVAFSVFVGKGWWTSQVVSVRCGGSKWRVERNRSGKLKVTWDRLWRT
jgi:hypothetical protein